MDELKPHGTHDIVCLLPLKRSAMDLLSRNSSLRELILSEPDYLPRAQALAKIEVFSRLLHVELAKA
jgi:hypothetical protein